MSYASDDMIYFARPTSMEAHPCFPSLLLGSLEDGAEAFRLLRVSSNLQQAVTIHPHCRSG
jgi:hypothetical protein